MAVTLGAKSFTKVVAKSETAFGTAAAFADGAGELLHTDIVGIVDPGVSVDLAEDKSVGVRSKRVGASATITAKAPVVTFSAAPISARNLPLAFDALATITPTTSSTAKAVATVAQTGTTVTITTSAAHGWTAGQVVTIVLTAGPAGYAACNGTYVLATGSASTFTYVTGTTQSITSGAATGNAYDGTSFINTFAYAPNQTDVDTLKTYSLYMTDGYQKFIIDGCVPTSITVSADQSGLLQMSSTWAGRALSTTSDSSTAVFASQPFIPGRLFGLKTQSSFITDKAGASATAYSTYITNWSLTLNPGVMPVQVLNGSTTNVNAGGVAYTSALDGNLSLTVASNSAADAAFPVSSIGSVKYVQVYGKDATGNGFWASVCGVVNNVSVIGSDQDGMILNTVDLQLAYDQVSGKSILCWIDSPLGLRP